MTNESTRHYLTCDLTVDILEGYLGNLGYVHSHHLQSDE